MVDLADVPVLGQLTAVGGIVLDLLLNSGDLVFSLLFVLIENVEMVVPILTALHRLADRLDWIPSGLINEAMTAVFAALLVIYVARLLSKYGDSTT